jgi:hypothetical protein
MFEQQLSLGSTERRIVLQTHKGTPIGNEIEYPADERAVRKFQLLLNEHKRWEARKPATGVYNCVGHVWASRRTMVWREIERFVTIILADDGYRKIDKDKESICPGDVVLYWQDDDPTKFIHVGIVHEMRPGVSDRFRIPWVLSKWDSTSGEALHHFDDVPFKEYILEFWTDRPPR